MSTFSGYFQQAQLSLAAYATGLERGAFGSQNAEYVGALVLAGMTLRQAQVFADSYSVVDQFTDPVSGFSGAVFASNGVHYFAISRY